MRQKFTKLMTILPHYILLAVSNIRIVEVSIQMSRLGLIRCHLLGNVFPLKSGFQYKKYMREPLKFRYSTQQTAGATVPLGNDEYF